MFAAFFGPISTPRLRAIRRQPGDGKRFHHLNLEFARGFSTTRLITSIILNEVKDLS